MKQFSPLLLPFVVLSLLLTSLIIGCAKQASPEGGPYDMTPPRLIKSDPSNGATHFSGKKIKLTFNENVKVEKSNEKVIFAPPQNMTPRILSGTGKSITIIFEDSLHSNTTYTIDFTDAIVDLNEGNPLEGFVFAFSTGDKLDSMEIRGQVLDAQGLYPVPNIFVGVHREGPDSLFRTQAFLRTGRTMSDGSFVITHLAPGKYRLFALNDLDHTFSYSQRSEGFAFLNEPVEAVAPSTKAEKAASFAADSVKESSQEAPPESADSLENPGQKPTSVPGKKEEPDHLLLYSVDLPQKNFLQKSARQDSTRITLSFSQPLEQLPHVRILGAPLEKKDLLLPQIDEKRKEVTYWITDSNYCKQDTLHVLAQYPSLDSLEHPTLQTDTLKLIYRAPKKGVIRKKIEERRNKVAQSQRNAEKPLSASSAQGGEANHDGPKEMVAPSNSVGDDPASSNTTLEVDEKNPHLTPQLVRSTSPFALTPRDTMAIAFAQPPIHIDTSKVHLYSVVDSTETPQTVQLRLHPEQALQLQILADLRLGTKYRLQLDSAAIHSCYGIPSRTSSLDLELESEDKFGAITLTFDSLATRGATAYVEILSEDNKVLIARPILPDSTITLDMLPAGSYYGRLWIDQNNNGKWDAGHYPTSQPEPSYLYPKAMTIQAKFTNEIHWNVTEVPLSKQRPSGLKLSEEASRRAAQSEQKRERNNLNEEYIKRMRERYGEKWNPSNSDRRILGMPTRAEEKATRKAEEEAQKEKRAKLQK
nr:Ig-like domain-containing protein [uncultured Porphyromonas sp.]